MKSTVGPGRTSGSDLTCGWSQTSTRWPRHWRMIRALVNWATRSPAGCQTCVPHRTVGKPAAGSEMPSIAMRRREVRRNCRRGRISWQACSKSQKRPARFQRWARACGMWRARLVSTGSTPGCETHRSFGRRPRCRDSSGSGAISRVSSSRNRSGTNPSRSVRWCTTSRRRARRLTTSRRSRGSPLRLMWPVAGRSCNSVAVLPATSTTTFRRPRALTAPISPESGRRFRRCPRGNSGSTVG